MTDGLLPPCLHLAHRPPVLHFWLLWELPEVLTPEPKEEEEEEQEEVKAWEPALLTVT